ncbi:MAG TPA: HipA N-terminal domain-containing protein, partial [Archangium sp.]|nr:HipA N-terminal domain-containing protein [Archangium sp.]
MQVSSKEIGILDVRLGDVHVGTLNLLEDEYTEFVISEEYRQRYPRPVLGQTFEDNLTRRRSSRMRLLPFFSNLLPEGPLRELIVEKTGVHPQREFFLIARLGEDLPGAVIITPTGVLGGDASAPLAELEAESTPLQEQLRF